VFDKRHTTAYISIVVIEGRAGISKAKTDNGSSNMIIRAVEKIPRTIFYYLFISVIDDPFDQ